MAKVVHTDIRKASTLPSGYYLEQKYFEEAKDKIFARTWQYLMDNDAVRTSGQLCPVNILEKYLDEPILFTRDKDDKLHCISNVCTHRGNILIESPCREPHIRCRYHGRRFGLDGKFLSMPEFEEVENFPSEKDNLPEVPFYEWGKFIFASLNPVAPVSVFIGDMQQRLAWLPLNEFMFDSSRSRDYLVRASWMLYCENYLEGFHIPYVHQDLNKVLDYSGYASEIYPYSNLQLGIAKPGEPCFDLPKSSPDYGKSIAAYYYWVFPNMMFNFYPWGLSLNVVRPLAVDLSKVSFLTFVWDSSKLDKGAGAMLDKVEREDEAIVENVQKGIRSRFYDRGRFSPKRETGVHHFHSLLAEFLS